MLLVRESISDPTILLPSFSLFYTLAWTVNYSHRKIVMNYSLGQSPKSDSFQGRLCPAGRKLKDARETRVMDEIVSPHKTRGYWEPIVPVICICIDSVVYVSPF